MKKIMKILSLILAVTLLLTGCGTIVDETTVATEEVTTEVQTTEAAKEYGDIDVDQSTTPVLKLYVNNKYWIIKDLTPYLGSDFVWITYEVEPSMLIEGFNQFAISSNTYSYGNLTDQSLDVFFTLTDAGYDSYISTNLMSTWDLLPDRYANMMLELYDGEEWIELPENNQYALDANTVTGIYVNNNGIYNTCRMVQLDNPSRYKAARLSVLMHVGSELMKEPEPEPIDEGDGESELDTTEPVLKVKLNGGPATRVQLNEYRGSEAVWITVPLDASYLREGTNRITLDSNVDNKENFGDTSIDLYCSPSRTCTDTQLSTDQRLSWIDYEDHRYANIYIELHNKATDEWVKFPQETETYRTNREHFVIGQFSAVEWIEYYCCRRAFQVTESDQYDGIRASIQMHIGKDISIVTGE